MNLNNLIISLIFVSCSIAKDNMKPSEYEIYCYKTKLLMLVWFGEFQNRCTENLKRLNELLTLFCMYSISANKSSFYNLKNGPKFMLELNLLSTSH